jgi:F-type H+-transporting ATPase subunit b
VGAILEQLEINQTLYTQLVIFAVLFVLLSTIYFKPFMKLFHLRHQKTVADREAAEKLMGQADSKFDEYKRRLAEERQAARQEYERALAEAKKEESVLLSQAREDAKKITQEAVESIARQREGLKAQLEIDVESMARSISEKLLSRKV